MEFDKIDLNLCKKGDILISSKGARLEYICKTPWEHYKYLDHVVRYVKDESGKNYPKNTYGTRTNDGFVFAKNRDQNTDHDIVIIKRKSILNEGRIATNQKNIKEDKPKIKYMGQIKKTQKAP